MFFPLSTFLQRLKKWAVFRALPDSVILEIVRYCDCEIAGYCDCVESHAGRGGVGLKKGFLKAKTSPKQVPTAEILRESTFRVNLESDRLRNF